MIFHTSMGPAGSGPTLVFVHGLTCTHEDWQLQYQALQQHYHCIGVDLRGHGQSQHLSGPYDQETLAADVVALLHGLELSNCILIGHSMGTRVITAAALQAPELITGLVFVDGSKQGAGDPEQVRDGILDGLADDTDVPVFIHSLFAMMFTDNSNSEQQQQIIDRAVATPPEVFRQLIGNMLCWDAGRFNAALSQLTIPISVVQSTTVNENRQRRCLQPGEQVVYLETIKSLTPQAQINIITDTGHFTQIDAADTVNNAIHQFAQSCGH